jgi:hypothetical protein
MNNRQNGRRRGRGGQQARNGQPGAPDRGSRLDNRARGNAAQLLEKYKTLARDAQMQGDRVNTEYYLQFADHYFRVLSESRSRFEEQQQRRPRDDFSNDFAGDDESGNAQNAYQQGDDGGDDNWDDGDGDRAEPEPRRNFRPRRDDRAPREDRGSYAEANGNVQREQAPAQRDVPQREPIQREAAQRDQPPRERANPPRERRPRNNGNANANGNTNGNSDNGYSAAPTFAAQEANEGRIEIDLPPSISGNEAPANEANGEAEAPRKVRRPRRPRTEAAPVEA